MLPTRLCNVLKYDQDTNLTITFNYHNETGERFFTFKRAKQELLQDLVKRMQINFQKVFAKKKNSSDSQFEIFFFRDNCIVDLTASNEEFWIDGSQLHINSNIYDVRVNFPSIIDLKFSKVILSGYPIYPYVDILNGNIEHSKFTWFKSVGSSEWVQISTGFIYNVKTDDIGSLLKVVCEPGDGSKFGIIKEAVATKLIIEGPVCPFSTRQLTLQSTLQSNQIRVVSYNLLADIYADTKYSLENLFSYCKPKFLSFDYRKLLIIKELTGYNADIFFLQELDKIFFEKALHPIFDHQGYGTNFLCKNQMVEGLAILYRKSKFSFIKSENHSFFELLVNCDIFSTLKQKLNANLYDRISKLKNNFQIILLKSLLMENKLVLVCNLHLYSKDDADHIRLIQSFICFKYIESLLPQINQQFKQHSLSVIISGDFNSTPEWGVVKLVKNKKVDSSLEDFRSNLNEVIEDVQLEHQLNLFSASGFPKYTNYTENFVGCLDYIFCDSDTFEVVDVVPMPSHDDVTKDIAIPSEIFPSDHIALVCTLQWKYHKYFIDDSI